MVRGYAQSALPYMPLDESTLAERGYRAVTETEVAPAKALHWSPNAARGRAGAPTTDEVTG